MALKSSKRGKVIISYKEEFDKALAENLDTSRALAVLWKLVKSDERPQDIMKTAMKFDEVLGLGLDKVKKITISKDVHKYVREMDKARNEKDWKKADALREKIEKLGYKVRNTDKGSILEKL